ncbi:MAG: fasciclin domain-containing protein [Bacteroidota bacterium]
MRFIYTMASLLLATFSLHAQVIYVAADAAGANDGSSWTDAYTDLNTALEAAADGAEVWIKSGTYLPPADTSFVVGTSISIIGGFAGTETSADQADLDANPTTLSGDFNGDDDPNDLGVNREDNVQIMLIDSFAVGGVSVSNLHFKGGYLPDTPEDDFIDFYSGAGIFSYVPLTADNLTFTECVADFGAGIAIFYLEAAGSTMNNITGVNNFSFGNAVIYLRNTANINIGNSTFTDNVANRGPIYGQNGDNVVVDNCVFTNNTVSQRAGGVGFVRFTNVTVKNCLMEDNTCERACGIYVFHDNDGSDSPDNRITIDSCIIRNNNASGRAAGIYNIGTHAYISNTDISGNINADGRGAGYYHATLFRDLVVDNCTFNENVANDLGSAIYGQGSNNYEFLNSSFSENGDPGISGDAGAICLLGDFDTTGVNQVVNIDSCFFFNNRTSDDAGAIVVQATYGNTDFNITNSQFIANAAIDNGGVMFLRPSVHTTIDNCEFSFNSAEDGGAIWYFQGIPDPEVPGLIPGRLDISNSIFNTNQVTVQGGAIDMLGGVSGDLVNNVFISNVVVSDGAGGAIIANGDSAVVTEVNLINNTFYENVAATLGDDVAAFLDPLDMDVEELTVNLTNNIFLSSNGLGNISIEDGEPTFVSNGGNFFNQMTDVAGGDDVVDENLDPLELFVTDEIDGFDLRPRPGSALVDAGVVTNDTPAEDLLGTDRDQMPDAGAYEIGFATVADVVIESEIHTELEGALILADLVTALQGDGPFTVFAPTDDAFALVDPMVLAAIVANVPGLLTPLLQYHVVPELIFSRQITEDNLEMATTLEGSELTFVTDGTTVEVNGATVIAADIIARNGIVHVIDGLLIPMSVSTEELSESGLAIEVFPNPFAEELQVTIEEADLGDVELLLYNINGQLLREYSLGLGRHQLELSSLVPGSYQLEVRVDGQSYQQTLLKQ